MKKFKILMLIGVITLGLFSFTKLVQEEWVVPAKYEKMTNPTEASDDNISDGKMLYGKHCKSCHGKEGLGDGQKADEVEGDLGDFSSEEFQAQSDGALFYKSYIGRDDMPNFEKKMPDEDDMWYIVSYMRTLGE
ncbi:Cytochrome C oxidase, cbb3-type, subunit III [Lutibacter agarilyticus]|uniref:Cytochrome C oxidase, cbb3-type, subunit III n=1 Tax=Lutibacter agarilyticus TaxID=1109740 RepID=A0A238X2F7_9FLAO|nr:c-type cytochrome [Lutibacter agarilyticus]SNR52763.1 Cytochrome C oxidase, cbb3-type, subunit III [Lutibacter agarilyticus]